MNYQELKLISSRELEAKNHKQDSESWLLKVWRSLIAALSRNSEIQVCKEHDRAGYTWWKLYDPITSETIYFDSEEELRSWIEESYRRPVMARRSFKPYVRQYSNSL